MYVATFWLRSPGLKLKISGFMLQTHRSMAGHIKQNMMDLIETPIHSSHPSFVFPSFLPSILVWFRLFATCARLLYVPFIDSLPHSVSQPNSIHIRWFVGLFVRSFDHSFIHSFIHSFDHSFIHSCIHAFMHSRIHAFMLNFFITT